MLLFLQVSIIAWPLVGFICGCLLLRQCYKTGEPITVALLLLYPLTGTFFGFLTFVFVLQEAEMWDIVIWQKK